MTWETLIKAKNIDKHIDELVNFRNMLSNRPFVTICLEGSNVKTELSADDIDALTEFFLERISKLEEEFGEL